jgi:hypothetical protein
MIYVSQREADSYFTHYRRASLGKADLRGSFAAFNQQVFILASDRPWQALLFRLMSCCHIDLNQVRLTLVCNQ